jgi:hypothetical protein
MRKSMVGVVAIIFLTGSLNLADAAIIKIGAPCSQVGAKK